MSWPQPTRQTLRSIFLVLGVLFIARTDNDWGLVIGATLLGLYTGTAKWALV